MKRTGMQILEGINVPHNNNSLVKINSRDIEMIFNLDEELTIKELNVDDSIQKVGCEIVKTATENGYSKIIIFIVISNLSVSELNLLIKSIYKQELHILWGMYEPNEGEPNRVIAIMQ